MAGDWFLPPEYPGENVRLGLCSTALQRLGPFCCSPLFSLTICTRSLGSFQLSSLHFSTLNYEGLH